MSDDEMQEAAKKIEEIEKQIQDTTDETKVVDASKIPPMPTPENQTVDRDPKPQKKKKKNGPKKAAKKKKKPLKPQVKPAYHNEVLVFKKDVVIDQETLFKMCDITFLNDAKMVCNTKTVFDGCFIRSDTDYTEVIVGEGPIEVVRCKLVRSDQE